MTKQKAFTVPPIQILSILKRLHSSSKCHLRPLPKWQDEEWFLEQDSLTDGFSLDKIFFERSDLDMWDEIEINLSIKLRKKSDGPL